MAVVAGGAGGADETQAAAVGAGLVALALADGVVDLALAVTGGTRPFAHRVAVLHDDHLARVTFAEVEPVGSSREEAPAFAVVLVQLPHALGKLEARRGADELALDAPLGGTRAARAGAPAGGAFLVLLGIDASTVTVEAVDNAVA